MATTTLALDYEPIHECFQQWREEQDSLDEQVLESLDSLEDYHSRLESWQREVGDELDQLQRERDRLEHDRADVHECEEQFDVLTEELNEARRQVTKMTQELLSRTDELRDLDKKRAELATELEQAKGRDREFTASLEEQKRWMDEQRNHWTEELKDLRQLVEQRPAAADHGDSTKKPVRNKDSASQDEADKPKDDAPDADDSTTGETSTDNPVLGSIVAQFGKLRRQRSEGRQKVQ